MAGIFSPHAMAAERPARVKQEEERNMKDAGRRDVKRAIFGRNDQGINVTLFEGPLRGVGVAEEDLKAHSEEAGEGFAIAWAAPSPHVSAEDYASTLPGFDLQLAPGETRFIRVEIAPGRESMMHRTPQVVDYLIAMAGELTMYLEDGSSCKIEAGDMYVQLAGWHSWKNTGSVPFVMAGVIIGIETDEIVPYGVEMGKPEA
jgi:mannose-6-phosphate isomerase-like protein (cupin superfamily)